MNVTERQDLILTLKNELQNEFIIICYINDEDKRIIFYFNEYSLIKGIFSDKWVYDEIDTKKYDLILSVEELIDNHLDYNFNILKII